jgi:hypothetical protein
VEPIGRREARRWLRNHTIVRSFDISTSRVALLIASEPLPRAEHKP